SFTYTLLQARLQLWREDGLAHSLKIEDPPATKTPLVEIEMGPRETVGSNWNVQTSLPLESRCCTKLSPVIYASLESADIPLPGFDCLVQSSLPPKSYLRTKDT